MVNVILPKEGGRSPQTDTSMIYEEAKSDQNNKWAKEHPGYQKK